MKDNKYSPYATNKGGKIESPKKPTKDDPRAVKRTDNDLRVKKG